MPDPFQQFMDEQQAPDSSDGPDPFSFFMDGQQKQARAILESSLDSGSQQNPEEKARSLALAKHLQLPVDTIEADPANAMRLARLGMVDIDALRSDAPSVAAWLEDPNHAAIAHDDLDGLRTIERTARALTPGQPEPDTPEMRQAIELRADQLWQRLQAYRQREGERVVARAALPLQTTDGGPANDEQAADPDRALWNDLGGPENRDQIIDAIRTSLRLPSLLPQRGILRAAGQGFGEGMTRLAAGVFGSADLMDEANRISADQAKRYAPATWGENLSGALGGSVPMLGAMVATRGRAGGALARSRGIAPERIASWLVPAEMTALSGAQNIQDRNQSPAEALLNAALEGVFTRAGGAFEPFLDAAGATGGKLAKEIGKEALEEGGTAGSQDVVTQTAGKRDDPYSLLRTLEQAGYGAAAGAIFGTAYGLPRAMADRYAQQVNAAGQAQDDAEALKAAAEAIRASKTAQRAPDEVASIVEQTLGQGGAHRYVDAEAFRESFDDPAAVAQVLGLGEEYAAALAAGGQVQIPTGRLVQMAATDPKAMALLQRTRRSPDAMTATEAEEFQARSPDDLARLQGEAKAAAGDATQQTTDYDREVSEIEAEIARRLEAVEPETVDRGTTRPRARIVAQAIGNLAKSAGLSPREVFNVQIRGERSRVIRGEQFDIMDAMIERLRSGDLPSEEQANQTEQGRELLASLQTLRDAMAEAGVDISASNQQIRTALADLEDRQGAQELGQGAAVVTAPKSGRLDLDALLKQWRKATGDRTPIGGLEAWERLANESDAVDAAQGRELNQPGKESRRASIRFGKGGIGRKFTVDLFKTADVSSFLHESGHLFLELMGDLSAAPGASPQLKADAQRVLDWLGAKDFASITEEQHEKFARGFERYLFEGVAPASNLRSAFATIKAWMIAIYKSVANLRVELTPEVRDVFNRLVAGEDAATQAEADNSLDGTLPREAFGSDEEFDRYNTAINASREATRDRLHGELLADYQERNRSQMAAKRAEVRSGVAAEVDAMPVYQAIAALQRGQMPDGTRLPDQFQGIKLDKADLVNQWGEAVLDKLPGPGRQANAGSYVYANENGVPVEQFARSWGFPSGDAMIEEMIQADDRASVIEAMTDQRVKESDPLTNGTLTDRANDALATDQRAELFRRELAALGRRTGQTPAPIEVLRQVARDQIADTAVFRLAPDKFRIAAAKAARRVVDAVSRQAWDEAYRAKTQEALNLELFRAARDAREAGEMGRKYLRTFDSLDKRARIGKAAGGIWTVFDPEGGEVGTYASQEEAREAWKQQPQGSTYRQTNGYMERIDDVLDGFQIRRASKLSLLRRDNFRKWIDRKRSEDGDLFDIDPKVIDDLGTRNWDDLTVSEQASVVDAVRNIEKQAQLKNRLLKSSRERELDKARSDLVGSVVTNQPTPRPDGTFDDILSRAMGKVSGYFDAHRKDSFLARRMDGDQDGGAVWDYIIRSRNEAAGEQETRSAEQSAKLSALFKEWRKSAGSLRQDIPGTRLRMTTEQRIALALNWGNKEGRQRVMSYLNRGGWGASDAQAVLDSLDAKDWKLVNGIVSQINEHWSDVAALERSTKGIEPEKVQALPFVTKAGVQPGGYYPIKYDASKSTKGGDLQAQIEARDMLRGAAAQTRKGHTKLRSMNVDDLALRFDFGVIGEHLSEVIHDLTHREMLMDQSRLLRDPEISQAILSRYGRGALDQFVRTATDLAVGDAPARTAAERMMKALRINNSAATFGFNLTSALMNLTGFMQSMTRVGPRYMAQGVARLFRSPDQINNGFRFVTERSDLMRNRAQTMLREVADATRAVQTGGWMQGMQQAAYYPMMQVQRAVDTVTWLGAYEQAMAKAQAEGKSGPEAESLAVALADQAVVDTQGSGRISDLSAFQRGGELSKLLTTFYSYFNVAANLQGSAIRRVYQNPKNAAAWGRLVADTALVWTLPAIMGNLIKSALQGDERDEEKRWSAETLAREQVSYGLGMLVGLREASGIVENGMPFGGPAGTRGLAAIAKGIGEAFDGDLGKADAKALANLAGVFTGLPAVQINRLIDAAVEDHAQGRDAEAVRRALFGAPRK